MVGKIRKLWLEIGGLSNASKMPGWSWGTPAIACNIGSVLVDIDGSVCSKCYALKGMYMFPVVKAAQEKRLSKLEDLPRWERNITELIRLKYRNIDDPHDRVFRWHDSGDVQSEAHLKSIVGVAESIPDMRFWLPTREYSLVRGFGSFPDNLNVRISAPMVGGSIPAIPGTTVSTVGKEGGVDCPAPHQGNECHGCRLCWLKQVPVVNYHQH